MPLAGNNKESVQGNVLIAALFSATELTKYTIGKWCTQMLTNHNVNLLCGEPSDEKDREIIPDSGRCIARGTERNKSGEFCIVGGRQLNGGDG
jgi:hypothetical protein